MVEMSVSGNKYKVVLNCRCRDPDIVVRNGASLAPDTIPDAGA